MEGSNPWGSTWFSGSVMGAILFNLSINDLDLGVSSVVARIVKNNSD